MNRPPPSQPCPRRRRSGLSARRRIACGSFCRNLARAAEGLGSPDPELAFPAIFPDVYEVLVFREDGGSKLVGAIELVSPGNKDRPDARRAFASKCSSYLQAGVGLVVVDIVTSRPANLHDELVDLLGLGEASKMPGGPPIYAAAYRPGRRGDEDIVDAWRKTLAVGETLPTPPLPLKAGPCSPMELEVTYAELCRRARLG